MSCADTFSASINANTKSTFLIAVLFLDYKIIDKRTKTMLCSYTILFVIRGTCVVILIYHSGSV